MAFPSNPNVGDSWVIGAKTWYWDGTAWTLSPITTGGGIDGQVEVLDDLLDVDTGGPPETSAKVYKYYLNENPAVLNGWGRFQTNRIQKKIIFHRYDIDGNDLTELFDLTNPVEGRQGTKHYFSAADASYEIVGNVTAKNTVEGVLVFEFVYDDVSVIDTIHNNGVSKLFTFYASEYGSLVDGAVLVYRQGEDLWKPETIEGVEGGPDAGNNITISPNPPQNPDEGDIWVDDNTYYMYIYKSGGWIALTGPEGGVGGGGNFANDSRITLTNMRGLYFDDNRQKIDFRLNQPTDSAFTISADTIVSCSATQPLFPEQGDLWISEEDYIIYVRKGSEWIALTGDDKGTSTSTNRLEQPCVINGGTPFSIFCDDDGSNAINITATTISPNPPASPKRGDLWFDSEHLELRVYYVTGDSPPAWVSSTHPGMRPTWSEPENAAAIRITGVSQAVQERMTSPFTAVLSAEVVEDPNRSNVTWGLSSTLIPATIDVDQDVEYNTKASYKFHKFGVTQITASITYTDRLGVIKTEEAYHRVSVTVMEPGTPITYRVTVVEDPKDADKVVFALDGVIRPHLNLERNRRYIFDQSHPSNINHPMTFYTALERDADGDLIDDIDINNVFGEDGADASVTRYGSVVDFLVPPDAPVRLAYGDNVDQYMGYWIYPFDPSGVVQDPNNPNEYPYP